jgi:Domain of unknown function (DUF4331)
MKLPILLALSATAVAPAVAAHVVSSHREAPAITETPKVDGTDFYMFRSYEPGRDGFVTLVADYIPLQNPYGGPNYFLMDSQARYEIHVDNDGDAKADITFRFQFRNELQDVQLAIGPAGAQKQVAIPLINAAPIGAGDIGGLNVQEFFTLDVVLQDGKKITTLPILDANTQASEFRKPVDNIGTKSIPDYAAYAASHVYDIALPGSTVNGRAFVGQRKDPFVVNLGETFDLVNLDPLGDPAGNLDDLADANVTSLILEIPIDFLVDSNPVLGGYTTASLPKSRLLVKNPSFEMPNKQKGKFFQVSRLGSPLVNEVVIGLRDKDKFNSSQPADDAQFIDYVDFPTLPALLEILFPVTAPTLFPRVDLEQAFLTGVPGLNDNGAVGEMLRLNTGTPVTPAASQNNLGVIGGDVAGFPNGRRPGDDVVDIELRVAMGVLLDPSVAPSGQLPLTDGAFIDASFFDTTFPYLTTPLPGSPQDY